MVGEMKDLSYDVGLIEQDDYTLRKQRIARKKQRIRNSDSSTRIHAITKKGRRKDVYVNEDGEKVYLKRIQSFDDIS